MEAIGSECPGDPLIPAEAELRGFGRRGGKSPLEPFLVAYDLSVCIL